MSARRIRQRPEEALHIAIARYLDLALPTDATWFHPANGGRRSKAEAGKFKAMGVKAGVADCVIVWRGHVYALEIKAPAGRLSSAQRIWGGHFVRAGGRYRSVRSIDETAGALLEWGFSLNARPVRATWIREAA